jgi:hypothetical protein
MVDQRMKLIMIFAWLIKIETNHPHLNMIEFSCIAHLVYPEEHEQPPPATASTATKQQPHNRSKNKNAPWTMGKRIVRIRRYYYMLVFHAAELQSKTCRRDKAETIMLFRKMASTSSPCKM